MEGFGESPNFRRWYSKDLSSSTSIEELITWVIDAQEDFDKLGLDYDNNFTIEIHTMFEPTVLGYVRKYKENRGVLHLSSDNFIKEVMHSTAIHEYFHHAQSRSDIVGRDLLIDGGKERNWLIEGSAEWFSDYDLFDSLDGHIYTIGIGDEILEAGLNTNGRGRGTSPYKRFSFLKLLSSKCINFDGVLRDMLSIDRAIDASGIENFKSELSNANCNFGNQLGAEKSSSLDSAFLYYQYATMQEDKISLLDSNEDNQKFEFNTAWTSYKKDWSDLLLMNFILDKIPAYGANSFKVDFDDFTESNGLISLNINTDKPLTVVGIRLDENGESTETGAENNFDFTTQAGVVKEYNLTDEDREGGLFITLLNATDEEVKILDLNLTIARFSRDNTTDIVIDHKRGLMWQDETNTWLDSWYGARRHCTALALGDYDDWRVPTYDELIHILDLDGEDTYRYQIFEHLGPVGYWSLDRNGGVFPDSESARVVNFGLATWIWINTSSQMNTRCVRTK